MLLLHVEQRELLPVLLLLLLLRMPVINPYAAQRQTRSKKARNVHGANPTHLYPYFCALLTDISCVKTSLFTRKHLTYRYLLFQDTVI